MKRKTAFIFCVLMLLCGLSVGCTSMRGHSKDMPKATADDQYDAQTEEMRKTIDNANPEKKKGKKKNGFLYGGLSSEAREIEDHLYGN
ncbi:MAG: hypothetical protein Q4C70_02780 [Planctomycetia bacterium]|nr:hypothetical protein [Planctomycetia bacterium]